MDGTIRPGFAEARTAVNNSPAKEGVRDPCGFAFPRITLHRIRQGYPATISQIRLTNDLRSANNKANSLRQSSETHYPPSTVVCSSVVACSYRPGLPLVVARTALPKTGCG